MAGTARMVPESCLALAVGDLAVALTVALTVALAAALAVALAAALASGLVVRSQGIEMLQLLMETETHHSLAGCQMLHQLVGTAVLQLVRCSLAQRPVEASMESRQESVGRAVARAPEVAVCLVALEQ